MGNTTRLYRRRSAKKTEDTLRNYSIEELFERFMDIKLTKGHFGYLMDYLDDNILIRGVNSELFRKYIYYMLNDAKLSPVTVNIRIRTMRAFLRFCHNDSVIPPIHEDINHVKSA